MMIGQGNHRFEVIHNWGQLPEGIKLGYTHGVVTDRDDNVYVFNTSKDAVVVFDKEGRFLKSWGSEYEEGAHGMLLNREGDEEYLYLCDIARGLMVKTTLDGEVLLTLGKPDVPGMYNESEERYYVPTDVAVAPNGDIYVTDGYGQHYIHMYRADGTYVKSWGGQGSEPGKVDCPHGVSVNTRGEQPEVYIADRSNNRIQVFTLEGEHIRFITDDLLMPCSFFQYKDELYLPDLFSRVTILDGNDKLIAHLGETENYKIEGWPNLPAETLENGTFSSPHGICVDSRGDVYVVEWIEYGRVTKLVRQS